MLAYFIPFPFDSFSFLSLPFFQSRLTDNCSIRGLYHKIPRFSTFHVPRIIFVSTYFQMFWRVLIIQPDCVGGRIRHIDYDLNFLELGLIFCNKVRTSRRKILDPPPTSVEVRRLTRIRQAKRRKMIKYYSLKIKKKENKRWDDETFSYKQIWFFDSIGE